jgi:uncharacterized protein
MKRIKSLATGRPLIFALVVTLIFILMVLVSSVLVNAVWSADTGEWYTGSTIGRLVSIFILLVGLARLGWLRPAGLLRLGARQTWLALLLPLGYAVGVAAYAMTGTFDFSISDPLLTGLAAIFLMTHAFLEEVAFRGLILHGIARAWDGARGGVIRSVLVSSFLFGAYHIIYLAGEPLPVVLLRIVASFLLGIIFGALVWRIGSIYPAAAFHGVLNFAGYLNLASTGIEPTSSSWLLLSLFIFPLALYGLYLLRIFPHPITHSNIPLSNKYRTRQDLWRQQ